MTIQEAESLFEEAELFNSDVDYNPPANSPLRAMSKKLNGGSFRQHLQLTTWAVYRVIATQYMLNKEWKERSAAERLLP